MSWVIGPLNPTAQGIGLPATGTPRRLDQPYGHRHPFQADIISL